MRKLYNLYVDSNADEVKSAAPSPIIKRLTHQEFQRIFRLNEGDGVLTPIGQEFLPQDHQSSGVVGGKLQPRRSSTLLVDDLLLQSKSTDEVSSGYIKTHLLFRDCQYVPR